MLATDKKDIYEDRFISVLKKCITIYYYTYLYIIYYYLF
jgi:hypothetical protein